MLKSHAFRPLRLATQRVPVSDAVSIVTIPASKLSLSVWIDNRGATDLFIELGETNPSDTASFPIPAMTSQPIGLGQVRQIRLKRKAGSAAAEVIVTPGEGL